LRYLREKHDIEIEEDLPESSTSSSIFSTTSTAIKNTVDTAAANIAIKSYKAFVSTVNITYFCKTLIMFIVIYSIAFYVVEFKYFKELLLACSASAFEPFLIHASNTVKR
jgi:hypothetical protein